jgi:hypothetical protein
MLDGFDTNKTFYTDTNGLEMAKRILNQKPGFDFSSYKAEDKTNNISSNFYPIVSAIAMRDSKSSKQVVILNDRT